jgi:peptide/nickel transport system permease protein
VAHDASLYVDAAAIRGEARAEDVLEDLTVRRRKVQRRNGAIATVLGLAVVMVGLYGVRSWSAPWRAFIAGIGAAILWYGVQNLGRSRWPAFQLGLWVAGLWVALVIVLAATASFLPIAGYDEQVGPSLGRPGLVAGEPLGFDDFGRSELSRCIYGARVAFTVGGLGAFVGLLFGGLFGLMAGFYKGKTDGIIGIFGNALLAFPPLILLLATVALFERNVRNISLALALITVPTFMRLTRAQTLVGGQREYVLSARAMGAKNHRIIFREILPNVILPVAAYTFLVVALLIVAEGSLAFVGVGIAPPRPSWGGMIARAQDRMKSAPHAVFVPAGAMFLTVLALNRVGEWARRAVGATDPKVTGR